jgi:prolyl-tRNA editing enzyme YbaK/EbsC (Cys-tRNA(Pro) deacylase)
MPAAAVALEATGYERGTITPFGSLRAWPVIVDKRVSGTISLGGGAHGVGLKVDAADMIRALDAQVADVSDLQ